MRGMSLIRRYKVGEDGSPEEDDLLKTIDEEESKGKAKVRTQEKSDENSSNGVNKAPQAFLTPPEEPAAAVSTAATSQPSQAMAFGTRRVFIFLSIFIGYASYYITRTSLTYAAPLMVADPSLNISLPQVGAMTSLFPLAYGFSKFLAGILSARFSATTLLAGGLAATAATNLAFGASSAMPVFCGLWALNGVLQGVGGPSCASILTNWWAAKERGTWWGLWSTAHNVGGFSAPLIVGYFANALGWRWGMWAPGTIGLVVSALILITCRDTPAACGYPPVEPAVAKPPPTSPTPAATTTTKKPSSAPAKQQSARKQGGMAEAVKGVMSNPAIWMLAVTYFFVYVVRQGVSSWFVFYLMQEKGVPSPAQAALTMSALELGGLCGGSFSGLLSDRMIRNAREHGGKGLVGKRIQVVMGYIVLIAAALTTFQHVPPNFPMMRWLNVFLIGFGIYGPQMLIGLCGAELVAPEGVGASQGVLGWIAYLGAANAGVPLSWLVQQQGWGAYFSALLGACGVALLLLAPLAGARSHAERQAERGDGSRGKVAVA